MTYEKSVGDINAFTASTVANPLNVMPIDEENISKSILMHTFKCRLKPTGDAMRDRQSAGQLKLVDQQMWRHFTFQCGILLLVRSVVVDRRRYHFERDIVDGASGEQCCVRWAQAAAYVRQCQCSLAQSSGMME